MKNRAKCKLCQEIIESFHRHDYVTCKCGEISVDGGIDYYRCSAKNWENFLRIDDEGNEIVVKVEEYYQESTGEQLQTNKENLIKMLDNFIESFDKMPPQAMTAPVTNYDLQSILILLSALFKA